jgi:transposase
MHKILSPEKRIELLARHKKERDKKIADRIKAILLADEGWTQENIAKALFIHPETVREHLRIYEEENRLTGNHKGSEPILTPEESQSLSDHLESKIYTKVKDIRAYIQETFKKELSESSVYQWLKSHSFTYKKPKIIPKNVDPEAQKAFIEIYNKVMKEAALEGTPVLFGDSVHPTQQTRVAYGWVKKKKDHPIETTSARKRMNIMGMLNLETMQFVYQDFETIDGKAAIEFLKTVEKAYPNSKRIDVIWDRAGYHTAEEVQEFLKTSRIRVHFLPPRSPNLNPIERLWKVMHEYVSNNRVYEKFKDFKANLLNFFDHTMAEIFEVLVSRITDNFQIINHGK